MICPQRCCAKNRRPMIWRVTELYGAQWRRSRRRCREGGLLPDGIPDRWLSRWGIFHGALSIFPDHEGPYIWGEILVQQFCVSSLRSDLRTRQGQPASGKPVDEFPHSVDKSLAIKTRYSGTDAPRGHHAAIFSGFAFVTLSENEPFSVI